MKYVLFGVNRVAKDFIYIFDRLNIIAIADLNATCNLFGEYKVYDIEYVVEYVDYDRIIICDYEKENRHKILESYGLRYERDFVYDEDFFHLLDSELIPLNKKIAVWGTGKMSSRLMKDGEIEPDIFIDTYKSQDLFYNKPVYAPEQINLEKYFVIVAVARSRKIYEDLETRKLIRGRDYCSFQDILGQPSRLLRKTIFSREYYDLECDTMLNHLEILNNGATRCCCTTFVEQDMNNILSGDFDYIWKSNIHKVMCLSLENHTYSFCDKNMCPLFVDKQNLRVEKNIKDYGEYRQMEEYPKVVALGYDPSCNLACSTCRQKVYFAKDKEKKKIELITEKVIANYLSHADFLILAGDGEVFASPSYKEIYTSVKCNPRYLRLLTNGTLFNKKNWKELKKGKLSKIMMTVSIDAATEETYSQIRCNGDFNKLKENMKYAAELRKNGELSYLRFNFVVQRKNYNEMIAFTQWGEELGVDEIFFTKILNWGTYSDEEFENVSMMEKDGITPKPELEEVLNNPIIKNSKIVDLGTIRYSHKIDYVGMVYNYYMWELEKRGGNIFK